MLSFIDIDRLKSLPYLTFYREIAPKTGEYQNKMIAEYHYCKITIYDTGIVLFSGSIHKLHNSLNNIKAPNYNNKRLYRGFNGNQLNLNNILETRTHLSSLFDCQTQQMIFRNIEFGVNTEPTFCPDLFTKGLIMHRGKLFEYRHKHKFAQAIHQQFILKIYNKSSQYKMCKHTLRVELKYLKMAEVNKIGIVTFADININSLNKAKETLIKRFNELLYYDYSININSLPNKHRKLLSRYSNPRYWSEDLKSNHRDREKKKLAFIIKRYSNNLHSILLNEIISKCTFINSN